MINLSHSRPLKKGEIENYFQQIENQIITLSEDRMTIDMMRDAKESFHALADDLSVDKNKLAEYKRDVRRFFDNEFGLKFTKDTGESISSGQLMASSNSGVYCSISLYF